MSTQIDAEISDIIEGLLDVSNSDIAMFFSRNAQTGEVSILVKDQYGEILNAKGKNTETAINEAIEQAIQFVYGEG